MTATVAGVSGPSYLIQPLDSDLALRQLTMALRLADVNEENHDFRWYETNSLLEAGDDSAYSLQTYIDDLYLAVINGASIGLQSLDQLESEVDATFTIEVGEEIIATQPGTQTEEDASTPEAEPDEDDSTLPLIIALALAVIVGAVVRYFVVKRKKRLTKNRKKRNRSID